MMADFVVPRHSAVMERLRRRIELFRRHHGSCENRYENTAMERLEIDRQQTLALHQRCLQTKAKRSSKHRQTPAANSDPAAQRGTGPGSAELADGGSGTPGEQSRNSTLIALQETVKRKLENAGSPLGGEHVNGFSDGYPPPKKACVEDTLGGLNGIKNSAVPPLSPMDTKHSMNTDSMLSSVTHMAAGSEQNSAGKTNNGATCGLETVFRLKDMKQEPVDDILPCILPNGGANGNNSLFPDLNLNDQDWSEIMEEFNRSVPYEDIQELFSDGFGDRKDPELTSTGAAQSLIPPDLASVKTEFPSATATSAFDQDSCTGSPQVGPTSSGPSLHTNSPVMAATSPALPVPQHPQPPSIQPTRPLQSHLLPRPPKDLSPAQQLQQLAAWKQHGGQILQSQQQQQHTVQKQQQQQQAAKFHQQPNHSSSWPQNTPPQSQLGGTFGLEKPTNPSLYPQDFPNPKSLLMPGQQLSKCSPKSGMQAGYMQPGVHSNILSHTAASTGSHSLPPNSGGQAAMLDYSNTKPLSHYEVGVLGAPRGPPTTQNQNKPNQAILNLMRHQMQKQRPAALNFRPPHLQHTQQEPGSYPSTPHVPGNTMTPQSSGNSIPGDHGNMTYMKQTQQLQLMSQQQKQILLQRQMMAEQEKQRQEQQLQRHLTRPPPQYQDQQNQQAQQNSFQPQQQASQFQRTTPCMAQQHHSGFPEHSISSTSQPIGSVNTLSGPTPGVQRMFSQTQSMMGLGVGQSSGPTPGAPPAASQADINLSSCAGGLEVQVMYGNMPMHPSHPNQQRPLVSTMSAAYQQNILAAQQEVHLKNQPNASILKQQHQQQLARLPNSMTNTMANNMSSSMPTSIQGALPTQAQPWQQQPQQHPGLQQGMVAQPGSANGDIPAGFPNSGFRMQSRMGKLPNNALFPQGGMGNSAAGRTLATMNSGQMMPNMNQQRTNNPAMGQQMPPSNQQTAQQGQPQPVPQAQQVLPDLGSFSQPQTAPNRTAGLQCNQTYQLSSTASQQLQFGYNGQSGGSLSGFPVETDLVDSLLKNQSTQEWMDDLDELLASHQ